MKVHTTNYTNTFILVAEDCPAQAGETPPTKDNDKTVANIQFDMIAKHPYRYDSDEVIFGVFVAKNSVAKNELVAAREKFFAKGQPCMRSSPLTKRYGWGVHSNADGKIAIYGVDSKEYKELAQDKTLKVIRAMRSKKA